MSSPTPAEHHSAPTEICLKCSLPANLACQGCIGAPSVDGYSKIRRSYCSKECQLADWSDHEDVCKSDRDRRSVYRAGDICQLAFFALCETLYDRFIATSYKEGDEIVFHETRYIDNSTVLFLFPHHLFSDSNDKHAMLVYQRSEFALAFMYKLLHKMLEGVSFCVHEVVVCSKNQKPIITQYDADGIRKVFDAEHYELMKLILNDGQEFAVDLSSPQFGRFNVPVLPWNTYMDRYVQRIDTVYNGGSKILELALQRYIGGHASLMLSIGFHFSGALNGVFGEWQEYYRKGPQELMRMPEGLFQNYQKNLIKHISVQLSLKRRLLEKTEPCWYRSIDRTISSLKLDEVMPKEQLESIIAVTLPAYLRLGLITQSAADRVIDEVYSSATAKLELRRRLRVEGSTLRVE